MLRNLPRVSSRGADADTLATRRSTNLTLILLLVCGAQFMLVLDLVVVNIALPSIQRDLALSQSDLQWVVIAYGLTFGGFLVLGGRIADLLGRRAVLVAGLSVFTLASLGAGLSGSLPLLLSSRILQGLGAAMAAPAALSILTSTFVAKAERNKALGIFGGVAGSAASIGLIVGGVLTGGPGWRWIFLINVPIGIALIILTLRFIPKVGTARWGSIDVLGAVTVTLGLLAIVFAINKGADYGWISPKTLAALFAGLAMLALFLVVERQASSPLIPLSMFRLRSLMTANVVAILVMGSFFGMAFQSTLFLQQVVGYSPLQTGIAGVVTAVLSIAVASMLTARVIARIGARWTLVIGQGVAAVGLTYLSRAPATAAYWTDLFPAFVASGVGIGLSGVAIQIVAFSGVQAKVSGLAGGMISTGQEFGAAIGLAIIATAAVVQSATASGVGASTRSVARTRALTDGFHRGALVAAGLCIAAALFAGLFIRAAAGTTASPGLDEPMPAPKAKAA
jgi:EmrB/QacA subfamily drug resistance transporter